MGDLCRNYSLTTKECKIFNDINDGIERLHIKTVEEEFIVMLENELNKKEGNMNNNDEYSYYDEDDEEYKVYNKEIEYGLPSFDLSIDTELLKRRYPLYDLSLEMNKKVNEYIGHLNYLDGTIYNDVNNLKLIFNNNNKGSARYYLLTKFNELLNKRRTYLPEYGGNIPALRSYIRRFNEFKSRFDNTKKGGARKRSKSKKRSKSHKRTKSRSKK